MFQTVQLFLPTKLTLFNIVNHPLPLLTQQNKLERMPSTPQSLAVVRKQLEAHQPLFEQQYPFEFIRMFLLIKINSLCRTECNINSTFLAALMEKYNQHENIQIKLSHNDKELFAQIILAWHLDSYLTLQELQNILDGACLIGATAAILCRDAQEYLKKAKYAFVLDLVALSGNRGPFIPQVHVDKNHKGQIKFAQQIYPLTLLHESVPQKKIPNLQDAYSLRCSPQVYGVAYDCLSELQTSLPSILNKFHFSFINGLLNLALNSDSAILKIDFLLCSLSEIGAMSFIRAQRILNTYLNESTLSSTQNYQDLSLCMQRTTQCVANNKLLCYPTIGDTINISNYSQDIFSADGKPFEKWAQMQANLNGILFYEMRASLAAIEHKYPHQERLFEAEEMNQVLHRFRSRMKYPKTQIYRAVCQNWA